MSLTRYFLLPMGGEWLVTLEGQVMARFASRTEAAESAIVMANLMGAMHHDADVMVMTDADAPLELLWSYGLDKAPRKSRKGAQQQAAPGAPHIRLVQRGEAAT